MDFILNEYHRNVSDAELINDILRVAKLCDTNTLSRSAYGKHGKYGNTTISKRFGGWNPALELAGLNVFKHYPKKHKECDCIESFLCDVKRIAIKLKRDYITTGEYDKFGQYSRWTAVKQFGSWDNILTKAGLSKTPFRGTKGKEITDEELFQDIERVWIKLGRQPTITDIRNGEFSFGQNTFVRRFGGWRGTLEAFVKYINSEEETTPVNDEIENKSYIETSLPTKVSQATTPP